MGKLFILTGPSGVGKNAVLDRSLEMGYRYGKVTTYSTRPMRKGEAQGHPYHFVDHETMQRMIDQGEMLEWAKVHTDIYGNVRKDVEVALEKQDIVILEIDPQGARTIREKIPEAKVVFLTPPSLEILEQRLKRRRSESDGTFGIRLNTAKTLLKDTSEWDYIVQNDENKLDETVKKVMNIIFSSKIQY